MSVSEAHKKASAKWNSSRDNILIRPDKETGARIRAAAAAAGLSVQRFILSVLAEYMDKEK
jgi:predicted DNA binding CopG/RHH family protein